MDRLSPVQLVHEVHQLDDADLMIAGHDPADMLVGLPLRKRIIMRIRIAILLVILVGTIACDDGQMKSTAPDTKCIYSAHAGTVTPTDLQVLANLCRADILDDPRNIGAYEILTFALWSNPSERLKAAEAGLRYAPDNYTLNLDRGTSLGRLKRYDEAVAALKVTASLRPDDAFPWIWMGRFEHERHADEQAILMYRKAAEVKASLLDRIFSSAPAHDEADAWREMGDVFQSLHRCKEASDAWARAASISRRWEVPRTCE